MIDDLTREEVAAVIDRMVQDLLEAARVAAPPVDAVSLARDHLGIDVCVDRKQKQRGRAQRAGGASWIFVRPEPSEERKQWTVAHEIGEHLKVTLLERLGVQPDETRPLAGESLANLFADRLLVPSMWWTADALSLAYDLPRLKERYRTASHEVVAWRMLDLARPTIITIIDNGRVSRRRSNAWRVQRALAAAEKECQIMVNSQSRPAVVRRAGWTVYGWPIHQFDWQREILRGELDDDAEWPLPHKMDSGERGDDCDD